MEHHLAGALLVRLACITTVPCLCEEGFPSTSRLLLPASPCWPVCAQDGRWAAGPSLLVQLGDLVDRGNNSLGVVDLFQDLQVRLNEGLDAVAACNRGAHGHGHICLGFR